MGAPKSRGVITQHQARYHKDREINLADTLDVTEVKVLWWLNTKTVETWLWTNTDNQLLGAERNKTQL